MTKIRYLDKMQDKIRARLKTKTRRHHFADTTNLKI